MACALVAAIVDSGTSSTYMPAHVPLRDVILGSNLPPVTVANSAHKNILEIGTLGPIACGVQKVPGFTQTLVSV